MALNSRQSNYRIEVNEPGRVVIRDLGPWSQFLSVTNDAENVVLDLASRLNGRRLFYYDSEGQLDELVVKNGEFAGFRPGPR